MMVWQLCHYLRTATSGGGDQFGEFGEFGEFDEFNEFDEFGVTGRGAWCKGQGAWCKGGHGARGMVIKGGRFSLLLRA